MTEEEMRAALKGAIEFDFPKRYGGQQVGVEKGVIVRSAELGIEIIVRCQRSQYGNREFSQELIETAIELYLTKYRHRV